jgi:serine O-acetyltransferase
MARRSDDTGQISADQADWSREEKRVFEWNPPRALLASLRCYQRHAQTPRLLSPIVSTIAVLRHRFWSAVTGADIPLNCRIGGGLLIPHPNGIVIHPDAVIGPNCLLFQQVTIGASKRGVPTIAGHVDIGAGAKIIGPIKVGAHVKIGANAVVVRDVPMGDTVVAMQAVSLGRQE